MWLLFIALLSGAVFCSELESYDYDNNLDANNDQPTSNVYILPKQIFNDGKPFYVKKDPVSGTLNFNAKTTPAEPIVDDTKNPTAATSIGRHDEKQSSGMNASEAKHDINVVKTSTQNIHDYLNLPVKYSSSKFVYPLVSSSYANLKYQGNNKNYISNHKYDSTTLKSVSVTANNYKKYKTPFPTKVHYASSSPSSMPKKVSTTTASPPMTNTFESTTKLTPVQSVRPHVSDTPSAPRPSYTTIGHKERVNNTIVRNSTPSAMRPIVVSNENRLEKENATTLMKPTVPPKMTSEKEQNGGDSMNFGDLFNYFFNSEDNETTQRNEDETSEKYTTISTRASTTTTQRPYNRYTTPEVARNASTTAATTINTISSSTFVPTRPPTTASTTTSNRVPSSQALKHEQNSNTQNSAVASSIVNRNTNSAQFQEQIRPFNGHGTNFHPPASNEMTNIVVAPGSHTASFVATGQLSAGNNFDRRPVADASYRPAPVKDKDIVTGSFATKGQVTDVYAQKQQQVNFHVPTANMNNIVVAPNSQTETFITTSQLAINAATPEIADNENGESQVNEQQIKNAMNGINVYETIKLSTQRPQGFTLPPTTSRSPSTLDAQTQQTSNEPNRVRFPAEHSEAPPPLLTLQQHQQQNNSIKFPTTQNGVAELPPATGHVKLDTRNEIYDRNNYKQIVKHPFNINRVVFERPQSQSNMVEQSNQMATAQVPPFNPNIHSPPFNMNIRKPTFIQYPRKNLTLPNILPQFRPNTQLPTMDAINHLRAGAFNRPQQFLYGGQNVRYKSPMHQYHYGGIRTKAPLHMSTGGHLQQLPNDQSHNRRHFELHQGNVNQLNNRIFDRTLPQHLLHRNIERNVLATQAPIAVAVVIEDQVYDESNAKVAETHVDSKPAVESKETPKVEPVTTLQQIQQQRLLHKQPSQPSHTIVDAVVSASENNENHVANKSNNSQLYVVYPVQDAASATTKNIQHSIPNKATTISLQQQQQQPRQQPNRFPYTLEKTRRFILNTRPSDEFDEKSDRIYERPEIAAENDDSTDDGEHPIAIAYTPTESNRPETYDTYSERISHHNTHRLDVDTSIDAINEQSFMAPFFPSVNLENTQSTHNGWSVVTPSTPVLESRNDNVAEQSESKSNKISTSLTIQAANETSSETASAINAATVESTTHKFDISNFQPELQGGFRPIYKTIEMPTVKPEKSDSSIEALVYDDEEI